MTVTGIGANARRAEPPASLPEGWDRLFRPMRLLAPMSQESGTRRLERPSRSNECWTCGGKFFRECECYSLDSWLKPSHDPLRGSGDW
jgi:hypothetical protein